MVASTMVPVVIRTPCACKCRFTCPRICSPSWCSSSLNKDHNHDLKGLFKGAATRASVLPGPFQDFYQRSLAKGIKPTMACLTLARKIAAITLTLWKKGENFDADKLKSQAA